MNFLIQNRKNSIDYYNFFLCDNFRTNRVFVIFAMALDILTKSGNDENNYGLVLCSHNSGKQNVLVQMCVF